jgi:hypothetical protein
MRLRYAGTCRICGSALPEQVEAVYERTSKTVRCVECPTSPTTAPAAPVDLGHVELPPDEPEPGVAGGSARREYERRKAKDEERLRAKWGRFGGIAVALSDERQSTAAWEKGAVGEERLGARLDALASDDVAVLHDRRIPNSKANIDHIVITRAGVWVIDAKRYRGRPELRVEGGLLRPRVETLLVGRRHCTDLVDGVLKQVELVREVAEGVPITGVLCFVEADWPLIGGAFTTRGVHVLWPKRLVSLLTDATPAWVDVAAARESITRRFRSA